MFLLYLPLNAVAAYCVHAQSINHVHFEAEWQCGAGVQASLTGLYQAIEARLALYKPLVSLQGRLDLLLAQAAPADPLSAHIAQGPLVSLPDSQQATSCARIIEVALDLVVCGMPMSSVALASANTNGLCITVSASAAHTEWQLVWLH